MVAGPGVYRLVVGIEAMAIEPPVPITLRRLRTEELGRLASFLREQYGAEHYGADPRYMSWFYLFSPCNWYSLKQRRHEAPVNVLRTDTTVLAIHAFVPFDARTPWGGTRGIWDIEWINGTGPRGSGRRLAAALLAEVDIYVGLGCNELSETAFESMGMKFIPEIHRSVVVTDGPGLSMALIQLGINSNPAALTNKPIRGSWCVIDSAEAIKAQFLDAYEDMTPFGVTRNRAWLMWRYDAHPYLNYAIVQNEQGAAVLRIENIIGSDFCACRVMEFLTLCRPAPALGSAVTCFAREWDCLFVDYFSSSAVHDMAFARSFEAADIRVLRKPRIPYMTQPFQFGAKNAFNMVIAIGGKAPASAAGVDLLGSMPVRVMPIKMSDVEIGWAKMHESMSPEEKSELMTALSRAYLDSPFWRARLQVAGINQTDIDSGLDFKLLPLLTKADILRDQAQNPPFGLLLAGSSKKVRRVHKTSGTSTDAVFHRIDRARYRRH